MRWLSRIRLLPHAGPGLLTTAVALNLALGTLPIVSLVWMSLLLERVHSVAFNWYTALALAVGALLLQQVLAPVPDCLRRGRRTPGSMSSACSA